MEAKLCRATGVAGHCYGSDDAFLLAALGCGLLGVNKQSPPFLFLLVSLLTVLLHHLSTSSFFLLELIFCLIPSEQKQFFQISCLRSKVRNHTDTTHLITSSTFLH